MDKRSIKKSPSLFIGRDLGWVNKKAAVGNPEASILY